MKVFIFLLLAIQVFCPAHPKCQLITKDSTENCIDFFTEYQSCKQKDVLEYGDDKCELVDRECTNIGSNDSYVECISLSTSGKSCIEIKGDDRESKCKFAEESDYTCLNIHKDDNTKECSSLSTDYEECIPDGSDLKKCKFMLKKQHIVKQFQKLTKLILTVPLLLMKLLFEKLDQIVITNVKLH